MGNQGQGDASFVRATRARGNDDAIGAELLDLLDGDLIVAIDLDVLSNGKFGSQFAEVLHQVIGKAVVVIDDQNQGDVPLFMDGWLIDG